MNIVVVAGNPKPSSRTAGAGLALARRLDPDAGSATKLIDVITLGPGLLGWGDAGVADAVRTVADADIAIFASPTFKATYAGVLKLFLDQFDTGKGLAGVVAIPLMLGAGPAHFMAPDLLLKPVLVELGATCPAPGVYQLDKTYLDDPALAAWVDRWGPVVTRNMKGSVLI